MTLTVYTFEDADGDSFGEFHTQDFTEADAYAREHRLRIIANEFEWADSETVIDYSGADAEPAEVEGEADAD